jgi:hypothetical protein
MATSTAPILGESVVVEKKDQSRRRSVRHELNDNRLFFLIDEKLLSIFIINEYVDVIQDGQHY